MPIDPSIPLQAGQNIPQFGPDLKQIITLQNLAQQMQARKLVMDQQQQGQNALKQIYGNPQNIGPGGYPTPNALQQLGASSPQTLLNLLPDINRSHETDLRARLIGEKVADEHRNWAIDQIAVPAVAKYREVLQQTGNQQTAQMEAQKVYSEGLETVKADGRLGANATQLNPTFDYTRANANIMGRKGLEKAAEMDAKAQEPPTPYQRAELGLKAKDIDIKENKERRDIIRSDRGALDRPEDIEVTKSDGTKEITVGVFDKDKKQYVAADGSGTPIEGKVRKVSPGAAGMPSEEAQDKTAEGIANYQQAPLTGYALRSPGAQGVMAKVLEKNPDYQATRYPEVAKAMRDFGTGKQGDITRSMNVGIDHLHSLDELTDALNTGNVSVINQVANAVKTQLGLSAAPTTFDAAKTVVGSEIIKAVQGAQGALGDREEVRKDLDKKLAPETLKSVMQEYRRLMGGQLRGLERQYEDATGFGPDAKFAFRKKLYPQTIAELEGAQTPGAAAAPPSTPTPAGKAAIKAGSLDVTKEQADKLPYGAAFTKPGDPKIYYKDW